MRTLFSLKATVFNITKDEKNVCFHVTGYGHGIGMSQNGVYAMTMQGKNWQEILTYFYPSIELKNISEIE